MGEIKTQLAVIGGGPAGVSAALTAARLGVETALVTNRPVLGGNSSSEIRVWTRGAVGGGNLFAEEMGVWGGLKLENLYRNPDANPVFWDEILLDQVLAQKNLQLFLNTDVFRVDMDGDRVAAVTGVQQGSEAMLCFRADYFIDATGDGTLGAKAGVPFHMGDEIAKRETLSSSILYYTRRESHPVPFIAPDYAYDLETIAGIVDRGGRVINECMSGSDCWWFEYGGIRDTIADAQDIALELKRLVMGVWNYIKNSGRFDAANYTLEWIGSLPGKRESRRMETAYCLTEQDILETREFPDGAFYGGWFLDSHPGGGMHDTGEENCVQIPVNIYQVPLRCLYHPGVPNLLFAGRNIGTERGAFFSSRIMNTCALSGQAAATLVAACQARNCSPSELSPQAVEDLRQTLLREDMFIPNVPGKDVADLAPLARITASSSHSGRAGAAAGEFSLESGGFVTFPALADGLVRLQIHCQKPTVLRAACFLSELPNRRRPGKEAGQLVWSLAPGVLDIEGSVPKQSAGMFCTWVFEPAEGVSLGLCKQERTGFLCGRADSPSYQEPMLDYVTPSPETLYGPDQACGDYTRPWGGPNQWCAAPGDQRPWLELQWPAAVEVREIRLYLDPDLNMELPSSRAQHWEKSHFYEARTGMPPRLVRNLRLSVRQADGSYDMAAQVRENCQRMVVLRLPQPVRTDVIRLDMDDTWGGESPAVYGVRVYGA